jgi:dTDP-4-dehydrorhamnose reductase
MTVLVTGVGGQLGGVLFRKLVGDGARALGVASPSGPVPSFGESRRVELADANAVIALVRECRPRLVVHAAAISSVAGAHANEAHARGINVLATACLARATENVGGRFVFVSTDMVFDGEAAPHSESSEPRPLSAYGRSKLDGERAALGGTAALVVRLPLLYGMPATPRPTTFASQVQALREGKPLNLFHDEFRTPLWLEDAATVLVRCAESELTGIVHAGGRERWSRFDMGLVLAEVLGVTAEGVRSVSRNDAPALEPRARDLSLDSSKYEARFGVTAGRPLRDALRAMAL